MDKVGLRPLVFDALRRTPQTHLHAIENEIRQRSEDYDRRDALLIHEIVWELLVDGVLAPGKNSLNLNLPFVHVTEYGCRYLEEGGVLARDPDGYVLHLTERTNGHLSSVVAESARDAAIAFHRGLYRISVVLLARAAEALSRELNAAISRHGVESAEAMEGDPRRPGSGFAAARGAAGRGNLREEVAAQLDFLLGGLETVVRQSTDDEGAPRLPLADRDRALALLLLFPAQCEFVYDLLARVWGTSDPHA